MATYLDRFTAICNALVDGAATVAQRNAIGDAFVAEYDDAEIAASFPLASPPATRATLTTEQRAALAVLVWSRFTNQTWRRWRVRVKEAEGRATALAETSPLPT